MGWQEKKNNNKNTLEQMDGRDTISVTDPFLVFQGVIWSILTKYFTSYFLKGSSFF